jgi:signal transduction histidine kinase
MSHELRTPLNAIFGCVTLLLTGRLDEAAQAKALETIERNARTQKRLIEDLLDASRIVTGKLGLQLADIALRPVLQAAIAAMQPAAEARQVRIVSALGEVTGPVRGDPARLQQVFCNLLSNAIKFTAPGGRIDVELAMSGDRAQICIADTGQGISPESLPHVFERFRQEDGSISRRQGGLGLGLAIVHHLVELHSGTVAAQSDGEGCGARFIVCLPIGSKSPAAL